MKMYVDKYILNSEKKSSMKRKVMFIILFLLQISFTSANAQDTVSSKYFPLNIGNSWTYDYFRWIIFPVSYETGYVRRRIDRDTIIGNNKYFKFPWFSFDWCRYDSTNGNLVFRTSSGSCSNYIGEKIFDSLSSSLGNINACQHQATFTRECINIDSEIVFNLQKKIKEFKHDGLYQEFIKYSEDFGIVDYCGGEPPPCKYFESLKGCVIKGVVYGDTTMTGIGSGFSNIPNEFLLYQNYPNPFNPKTIINYQLKVSNFVVLKVYDILGNEIAILINEKKNPGRYSVEFDGTNFSSGIYFYRLEVDGNVIDAKRMVLLK